MKGELDEGMMGVGGGASLAGQILADLGADEVLLEPPGGVVERMRGRGCAIKSIPTRLAF